jgi:Membrane-bound lysozyme-inhibitor of c-type lysozyme
VLNVTVATALTFATTWRCGAQEVTTGYSNQTMVLTVGNMSFPMRPVKTASGSKFEARGDPTTTAWQKGKTMTLVVKGRIFPKSV